MIKMANDTQNAKISGYLEKKGKLRMVSSWKKYWFVLEGRLLLYYRSRAEYEAISPCKGSITLGPPCSIKPNCASSCTFQIETRANTINLRAENRCEQEKWMQAILATLNQNPGSPAKMSHFRYSSDNLVPTISTTPKTVVKNKKVLARQNTFPDRFSKQYAPENPLIERMVLLGAHTYGGSLETISKMSQKGSPNLPKNENLKRLLQNSSCQDMSTENKYDYVKIERSTSALQVSVENENYQFLTAKNDEGEVVLENEQYAGIEPKRREHTYIEPDNVVTLENSLPTKNNEGEVLVDNEHYAGPTVEAKRREHIYTEPNNVENGDYVPLIDPIYDAPGLDHNENKVEYYAVSEIYDPNDTAKIYSEPEVECNPELPPRPKIGDENDSQGSVEEVKVKRKSSIKKLVKLREDKGKKSGPKRNSFLHRMFKKKQKNKEVEDEELKSADEDNEPQKEVIILDELQKLLDNKKNLIEEKLLKSPTSKEYTTGEVEGRRSPEMAPPKDHFYTQKYSPNVMDYADCLSIPRPKLIPKRKRNEAGDDKLKTIDEILDDLENEKTEKGCRRPKVKVLIERFNECGPHEEVEMRRKKETDCIHMRHSDDLNRLLEELCKVTNAPVLTPGATNSLITTPLTDEEWKDLIPIRTRRFSEPDYDVPRPHSLLQIIPSRDSSGENPMEPTRFFGPVLINKDTNNRNTNEKIVSITPDSLEIEGPYDSKNMCNSSIEEDRSLFSYTSHNYGKESKQQDSDELNSRPQSFSSLQTPSIDECEHMKSKTDQPEDRSEFMDSLEPFENQTSTTF